MVKLGFYVVEKCYKNRVYKHELVFLRFPKELHEILRCLRDKQLEMKVIREGKTTHIMLIDKQEK